MRSVLTGIITRVGGSIARISQIATAVERARSAFLRIFLGFNVSAVGAVGILTAFTGTSASCRRMEPVTKSFREGEVVMEVLSSRVLLHPTDFERSFRFYAESLGLHVYRERSSGSTRDVVFFLGEGFLELSGSSQTGTSESVGL